LAADVMQARRLGFDAKSTFNPRQVALINEYFSPTPDELEYAQRVAEAFQAAAGRAEASVVVGGQLVDRPIVLRALRLLEFAKTLGLPTAEGNDG
jgi:citrate lyase subunit beta/citryl-CoA lyase